MTTWSEDLAVSLEQAETADAAITMAIGSASMCWENVDQAGVFQSEQALVVSEVLAAHLRARWCIPTPPAV